MCNEQFAPLLPERATPFPRTFGALLRHHRILAGLTQDALAKRAGLSARAISDLERGLSRTPQQGTLDLLSEALQLSAEERDAFEAVARREELQAQAGPPPLLTPVSFPARPDGSPIATPATPDGPEEPVRLFDKEKPDATPAGHPDDLMLAPDGRVPPAAALPSGVESLPLSPPYLIG